MANEQLAREVLNLKSQFERIAAHHPNEQPHYPGGVRPFGTGDLRHFIEVLSNAADRLAALPAGGEGVSDATKRMEKTLGAEFVRHSALATPVASASVGDRREAIEEAFWHEPLGVDDTAENRRAVSKALTFAALTPAVEGLEADETAAVAYIRDWCPDHVRDYVASLATPTPPGPDALREALERIAALDPMDDGAQAAAYIARAALPPMAMTINPKGS